MRLVLIEWHDSVGCASSWQEIEDPRPKVLVCRSVGWLVYDGDDCKTIVPHLSEEQPAVAAQGCGDMTIPIESILKIQDLSPTTMEG